MSIGLLPVFEIGAAFAVLGDEHAEGLHVETLGADVVGLDAHLHIGEDVKPLAVDLIDEDVAGLQIAVRDIEAGLVKEAEGGPDVVDHVKELFGGAGASFAIDELLEAELVPVPNAVGVVFEVVDEIEGDDVAAVAFAGGFILAAVFFKEGGEGVEFVLGIHVSTAGAAGVGLSEPTVELGHEADLVTGAEFDDAAAAVVPFDDETGGAGRGRDEPFFDPA